ncbi:hypothetical protein [Niallia taxi]|uniref:hypothetical protein n=1 Tax=Niallia taxi TaxID=2499688 RepID=UPI0015F6B254|nr:hypothetical protein [Niallia taxi]
MSEKRMFEIEGNRFVYDSARSVIEALCSLQWQEYSYQEFLGVIKNRLKIYTGKEEVLFYNEEQVAALLIELGEVKVYGEGMVKEDMKELFEKLVGLANVHKKDDFITEDDFIALIYKYWYAECSENELHEDLSYLVDWDAIPSLIEGIRDLDPDKFEGSLKEKYLTYFNEIQDGD